jgi:hypothetical protein
MPGYCLPYPKHVTCTDKTNKTLLWLTAVRRYVSIWYNKPQQDKFHKKIDGSECGGNKTPSKMPYLSIETAL